MNSPICEMCGREFAKTGQWQKFCSLRCRRETEKQRKANAYTGVVEREPEPPRQYEQLERGPCPCGAVSWLYRELGTLDAKCGTCVLHAEIRRAA